MDKFKEKQNRHCGGVGGIHCYCCNEYTSKNGTKAKLNRKVRRILKGELKKNIEG